MDLSIILPAYNEALVIESTIEKIIEYLKNRYFSYELIVVNDGSVDQTGKIVKSLNLPVLRLIEHEKNLGKGAAVKSGMLMAKGENLLFLDADYSTTIDNLAIFLSILKENQADIVISRAGAHTTYELAALGKPALFIPIKWASHNEQYKNARELINVGIASMIPENRLTPESLVVELNNMLNNLSQYLKNADLVKQKVIFNAKERIVNEIKTTLNTSN